MDTILNRKTQLIEVIVNGVSGGNTSQRIQFPDQPYLRNTRVWGIETFASTDVNNISPGSNAVVTPAQLEGCYITLYTNDPDNQSAQGEYIQLLPLIRMRNMQTNSASSPFAWMPFLLAGQTVYWEKSYITIPTSGGLGNTANLSFLLNVSFSDLPPGVQQ